MYELIKDTCFSFSDLLYSVWETPGSSTSLLENRRGHTARAGEGGMNWESSIDISHYQVWNSQLVGRGCVTQGADAGALWPPREWDEGGSNGKGYHGCVCVYVYNYDWFTFLYGKNEYNVVKQFPTN